VWTEQQITDADMVLCRITTDLVEIARRTMTPEFQHLFVERYPELKGPLYGSAIFLAAYGIYVVAYAALKISRQAGVSRDQQGGRTA
jgi:hypothetical protein